MLYSIVTLLEEENLAAALDLGSGCIDPSRAQGLLRSGKYTHVLIPATTAVAADNPAGHDTRAGGVVRTSCPCTSRPPCTPRQLASADVLVLPYSTPSGATSYHPFVHDLEHLGASVSAGAAESQTTAAQQAELWADAAHIVMEHSSSQANVKLSVPEAGREALEHTFQEAGYTRSYLNTYFRYQISGGLPARVSDKATARLAQLHASGMQLMLGPLEVEDAELVDSLWPYRTPSSLQVVRRLITQQRTCCVRLDERRLTAAAPCPIPDPAGTRDSMASELGLARGTSPAPVAWVLQYSDGLSIGMAHTLEAHRRKGLMSLCITELLRQLFDAGQREVVAFVLQDNLPSQRLMESLGFEVAGSTCWVSFTKSITGAPAGAPKHTQAEGLAPGHTPDGASSANHDLSALLDSISVLYNLSLEDSAAFEVVMERTARILQHPTRAQCLARSPQYPYVLVPAIDAAVMWAGQSGAHSRYAVASAVHVGDAALDAVRAADILLFPYQGTSGRMCYYPFVRDLPPSDASHFPDLQHQSWGAVAAAIVHHAGSSTSCVGVSAVPEAAVSALIEAFQGHGYSCTYSDPHLMYRMEGSMPPAAAERAAAKLAHLHASGVKVSVGPLTADDAVLVNSMWPHATSTSLQLVQQLIADHPSCCVRIGAQGAAASSTSAALSDPAASEAAACARGQPAAWVLQYNDGSIGMAHTLEACRQQGLMSVCITQLAEHILSRGRQAELFAFAAVGNLASQHVMASCGFQRVPGNMLWLRFERISGKGQQHNSSA